MDGVGKVCVFQWQTSHILETVRDGAKVAISQYTLSDATEIIDLG